MCVYIFIFSIYKYIYIYIYIDIYIYIHNLRLIAFEEILRLARRFPDEESSDEDEEEEFEVQNINDGYESDIEDNDEESISDL